MQLKENSTPTVLKKPIRYLFLITLLVLLFSGCEGKSGLSTADATPGESGAIVTVTPATSTPNPTPVDTTYTAWILTEYFYSTVNVRSTPGTSEDDADIIAVLYDRDEILCTGESAEDAEGNAWLEITVKDESGYVRSDFVVTEQPLSVVDALSAGVQYNGDYTKLVRIETLTPYITIDLTLADDRNFISEYSSDPNDGALYTDEIALVQYSTGLKLAAAAEIFHNDGYELVLWDAYRPYSVTVAMYEVINDPKLIAGPTNGSKHNRGAAVDVTLYKDGEMVNMPTSDRVMDVSEASRTSYMSTEQKEMMNYLTDVMEECGFITYRNEWWHFNDSDWEDYPLMDFPLSLFVVE